MKTQKKNSLIRQIYFMIYSIVRFLDACIMFELIIVVVLFREMDGWRMRKSLFPIE